MDQTAAAKPYDVALDLFIASSISGTRLTINTGPKVSSVIAGDDSSTSQIITGSTKGLGLFLAQQIFPDENLILCGSKIENLNLAKEKMSKSKSTQFFQVDFLDNSETQLFCEEVEKKNRNT